MLYSGTKKIGGLVAGLCLVLNLSCAQKIEDNSTEMKNDINKLTKQVELMTLHFEALNELIGTLAQVGLTLQDFLTTMVEAAEDGDLADEDDFDDIDGIDDPGGVGNEN